MKRKQIRLAAVLSCAALLLTGCRTDTYADYPVSHKEYLDYSLGEGYQFSEPEYHMYADGSRSYTCNITYQQQTLGKKRRFGLESFRAGEHYYFDNEYTEKLDFDHWLLASFYPEANAVAMQEFADTILSKYYPAKYNIQAFAENLEMHPKANVCFSEKTYYPLLEQHVKAVSLAEDALKPDTGLKLCTASLKSIAQDSTVIPTFHFTISEESEVQPVSGDPAPYLEAVEKIYQDYLHETDSPQNYRFTVMRSYKTHSFSEESRRIIKEILYDKAALTGIGEFSASERYGLDDIQIADRKMCEELGEILAQQSNGNT